jgi:hypothetical protein
MAICSCGLPARCCQPAVAEGIIYADLRSELSTHLALQALLTQSSVCKPLLQAFPFPSTLWEVTLHPLSQACVFIYSSRGRWVFPLSCGVFLPLPLSQAFPLLVAGHTAPLLPSLARPGLFIYSSGKDSPPPLQCSVRPTLFATCLYCSYCLLLSFSFFPGWGGQSVQGAMLIWPRVACGSTVYCLAHLVCFFPSCLGMGNWCPRGPPGFSIQCEVEILCAGWRCGGVKVLPLLGDLACEVCLQHFSKISLYKACFLLPPSSCHLGIPLLFFFGLHSIYLFNYHLYLSIYHLSICLPIYHLSIIYLSSIYQSIIYLAIYHLSVIYLSINHLSIIYLSMYLSFIYLLSIYLSSVYLASIIYLCCIGS